MCFTILCVLHFCVFYIFMRFTFLCFTFLCVLHFCVFYTFVCFTFYVFLHFYVFQIFMCFTFLCVLHSYVNKLYQLNISGRHVSLFKTTGKTLDSKTSLYVLCRREYKCDAFCGLLGCHVISWIQSSLRFLLHGNSFIDYCRSRSPKTCASRPYFNESMVLCAIKHTAFVENIYVDLNALRCFYTNPSTSKLTALKTLSL